MCMEKYNTIIRMPYIPCIMMCNSLIYRQLQHVQVDSSIDDDTITLRHIQMGREAVDMAIIVPQGVNAHKINIDAYDLAVMDAIYTLHYYGQVIVTVNMIQRVLSGDMRQEVTMAQRRKIKDSVDKLSMLTVYVDIGDLAKKRRWDVQSKRKDKLLPVTRKKCRTNNGRIVDGYMINDCPIICWITQMMRQIVSVPIGYMDLQLPNTTQYILLQRYLLCRIMMMRNGNNGIASNRIRFAYNRTGKKGLLGAVDIYPQDYISWKKKKHDIRKCIVRILNAMIDRQIINQYREYYENSKFCGYEIDWEAHNFGNT